MGMTVKFFATLRAALGVGSVELEHDTPMTVREVLERAEQETGKPIMQELFEDDGSMRIGAMVLVDGKNISHLNGLDTTVQSETLSVFPPAGGG